MSRSDLFGSHGADDEQGRARVEAQHVVQPLQRVLIAPLQIVEQQEKRLLSEGGVRQRLKELLALPVLGQRFRVRDVRSLAQELRQESCDFTERDNLESSQSRIQASTAQPVGHWRLRPTALGGVRACPGRGDTLAARPGQQLLSEPGLADTGVPGQHDEPRRPRAGFMPDSL
jgi:hypothetical protein